MQRRVDALGELLGLSRTRVEPDALAEAGELLDRIAERRRLSLDHTVVALAGPTGSGKSSLFNVLTGLELSEVGVRRPTTEAPVACAWDPRGSVGLLDRLGIAPHARFARRSLLDGVHTRPGGSDAGFEGLILLDLPDHDSATGEHRRQVDRMLALVDVVVWVVDPEKYADALLHERYLRPLASHADVTLVVLNQADRLSYEAADQVLDDLRRLLDEDGLAVGEHGEAGAVVLRASTLTGEGVADVRAAIGQIAAERGAANRRVAADIDRATARLRPVYVGAGALGLTDHARETFVGRLAEAVGAGAVGHLAEQEWADAAARACGVPWGRLVERTPGDAPAGDELDGEPGDEVRGELGGDLGGDLDGESAAARSGMFGAGDRTGHVLRERDRAREREREWEQGMEREPGRGRRGRIPGARE
ncbi:GTPase [Streptantibioticus silvisoli]|uniref:GTPase n=1 Tax=Streptantibioticus silvisoli TaxID=2705255 RepID=UPI003F6CE7AC